MSAQGFYSPGATPATGRTEQFGEMNWVYGEIINYVDD